VPVPELGPVRPVLWEELATSLDGLMLATGGVWLESFADAAKAYPGLFSGVGLKQARARRRTRGPEGGLPAGWKRDTSGARGRAGGGRCAGVVDGPARAAQALPRRERRG